MRSLLASVVLIGCQPAPAPASTPAKPKPPRSVAVSNVLSAVGDATCALHDGAVHCWGDSSLGQLGEVDVGPNDVVTIALPGPAAAVALGGVHGCALLADDRSVQCWGEKMPHTVALTGVLDIVVGIAFDCALLDDGEVRCWGESAYMFYDSVGDPMRVALGRRAVQISAGRSHACALLDDGSVKCWGADEHGARGGGPSGKTLFVHDVDPSLPPVTLDGKAIQVAAGGTHTCAIMETGRTQCWGRGPRLTIKPVKIAAGYDRTCGLTRRRSRGVCGARRMRPHRRPATPRRRRDHRRQPRLLRAR